MTPELALYSPRSIADRVRDGTLAFYLFFVSVGGFDRVLRSPDSATGGAGSATNQAVLIGVFLVAVAVAAYRPGSARILLRGSWPLLTLGLVVIASVAWSDSSGVAFRRAVRFSLELGALVLLVNCYAESGLQRLFEVVTRVFALVLVLDLLAVVVPSMSFTEIGYQGIHLHKNEAGGFAMLSIPFFAAAAKERWMGRGPALALLGGSIVLLVASQSKTSFAVGALALMLAITVTAIIRLDSAARRRALGWSLMAAPVVAAVFFAGLSIKDAALESVFGDSSLTGRAPVWSSILSYASERPLLGHGYGSIWNAGGEFEAILRTHSVTFMFTSAHNGYLDVLAQLGFVGMAAVGLMGLVALFRMMSPCATPSDAWLSFISSFVVIAFWLHNMTESSLLRSGDMMWVIFVICFQAIAIRRFRVSSLASRFALASDRL